MNNDANITINILDGMDLDSMRNDIVDDDT